MPSPLVEFLMLATLLTGPACQVPASRAQTRPDPPATTRASRAGSEPLTTGVLLDRIEQQAAGVKSLHAELVYDRIQQLVGDRQRRFGSLIYQAGPPARFAVHFDRLLVDRRLDHDDRWYLFDGQWLVERYDDEKLMIKRQVVPPPTPGQPPKQANPLAFGTGPFALPISLKKQQVLKRFRTDLVAPAADDPPQPSHHLRLLPKPEYPSNFVEIDLWYDRQTLLPIRVRTLDDSQNQSLITLSKMQINEPVDPAAIDTTPPTEPGWRVEVKPWVSEKTP